MPRGVGHHPTPPSLARRAARIVFVLALATASSTVFAQEVPRPPSDRRGYGWQMMIGFAASDASVSAGVVAGASGWQLGALLLVAGGFAGHALTAPVTHWAHGAVGKGFLSLGLTLGATAVGAAGGFGLGAAMKTSCGNGGALCIPPAVFYGTLIGAGTSLITVNVIDALLLAREARPAASAPSVSFAPVIAPRSGGLAVTGAF